MCNESSNEAMKMRKEATSQRIKALFGAEWSDLVPVEMRDRGDWPENIPQVNDSMRGTDEIMMDAIAYMAEAAYNCYPKYCPRCLVVEVHSRMREVFAARLEDGNEPKYVKREDIRKAMELLESGETDRPCGHELLKALVHDSTSRATNAQA